MQYKCPVLILLIVVIISYLIESNDVFKFFLHWGEDSAGNLHLTGLILAPSSLLIIHGSSKINITIMKHLNTFIIWGMNKEKLTGARFEPGLRARALPTVL